MSRTTLMFTVLIAAALVSVPGTASARQTVGDSRGSGAAAAAVAVAGAFAPPSTFEPHVRDARLATGRGAPFGS